MGKAILKKYINHLYDETTDGYIEVIQLGADGSIIGKKNYQSETITEVINKYIGLEDVYISSNTSFNGVRQVKNIRQLRSLYIDIDINQDEYSKNDVIALTYILVDEGKVPKPTMVVDSGRGLHFYWRIYNAPVQALGVWQTIEDYLYYQLKQFGADSKATDSVRVLRLVETINSKNKKKCSVFLINNITYSMYDLLDEYINIPNKVSSKKIKSKTGNKVIKNKFFNSYSLHLARLEDIKTLCELRGFDIRGDRNFILHCFAYWTGVCIRSNKGLREEVIEFNNKFKEPLPNNQVEAILRCIPKAINKFIEYEQSIILGKDKRVSKGMRDKGGYWYKNETLIERLNITLEEQSYMKTIIGIKVKYKRNNERRTPRNNKGLTRRQQQKQDTIYTIKELKAKGLNNTEIAKELNMNVRSIRRIINS